MKKINCFNILTPFKNIDSNKLTWGVGILITLSHVK